MKNRNRRWIGRAAALGRAIGAKPSGRGGRRFPKDGDGDGFYSPRPGMPDKTPVPPEFETRPMRTGNDLGLIGSGRGVPSRNFNAEAQQIAVDAAKRREERVRKQFGDVRQKKTARKALQQVFPNARLYDFLNASGKEIRPTTYNYVVALLDMGQRHPEIAKHIVSLRNDYPESPMMGGYHRLLNASRNGGFNLSNGDWSGSEIALNPNYDVESVLYEQDSDPWGYNAPWANLMGSAMGRSANISPDDRDAVVLQSIAIHEFAHAMHAHFGLDWHGATVSTEQFPAMEYLDATLDAFNVYLTGFGLEELEEEDRQILKNGFQQIFDEAQLQEPITNPEKNNQRVLNVAVETIRILIESNDIFADYGIDPDDLSILYGMLGDAILARTYWDGVPERDRSAISRNLSKVSTYAGNEHDPFIRYLEGVADTISAMEFGYTPPSKGAQAHIGEILKKQDRLTLNANMSDDAIAKAARRALASKLSLPSPPTCKGLAPEQFVNNQNEDTSSQRPARQLKGKALGVPIGAGDDEPDDGDGDGMYTAIPGGEDNVPMPPDTDLVEWDEIEEIIDWDVFPQRGRYDDDEMYFLDQNAESSWRFWNSCRAIRKAAYRLAGLSPDVRDPNIERSGGYFGSGFEVAEDDEEYTEYARYYMGSLAIAAKQAERKWKLYRAVDVAASDREAFEQIMQPGNFVDIPLLATADRRSQGPNDFLRMYGTDYLIEIDENAARKTLSGGFGPFYTEADEDETLSTIELVIENLEEELATEDFDDEEKENRKQFIESLRELLDKYEKARKKTADEREAAREALEFELADYELVEPWRWAGEEVDEGSDSRRYWGAFEDDDKDEYSEELPRENITGGRFEVIEVVDDPEGRYGKIIRLRQIGVFDPQNRGRIVPTEERE